MGTAYRTMRLHARLLKLRLMHWSRKLRHMAIKYAYWNILRPLYGKATAYVIKHKIMPPGQPSVVSNSIPDRNSGASRHKR